MTAVTAIGIVTDLHLKKNESFLISFFFFLPSKVKPEVRPWTENECEATAIFPRQLVKHNINGQLLNGVLRATAHAPAVAQCDSNSDALFLNCKGCVFHVIPCMPDGTFSIYFGFFYLFKWERGSIWEGEAESGSLIGWNLPSVTFSRFNQILSEHLQRPR